VPPFSVGAQRYIGNYAGVKWEVDTWHWGAVITWVGAMLGALALASWIVLHWRWRQIGSH